MMTDVFQSALSQDFVIRFSINLVALFVLVRLIYYPRIGNHNFLFAFILFGVGVNLVTYLLHSVEFSMGFAFGLFAIFSMLRYRTESISIKEMTYLFMVIVIALLSSVGPVSYWDLVILCTLICFVTFLTDTVLVSGNLSEKLIQYEKIHNIKPENREMLIQDLRERTGLNIQKAVVEDIDFLRDTALLRIYFKQGQTVIGG